MRRIPVILALLLALAPVAARAACDINDQISKGADISTRLGQKDQTDPVVKALFDENNALFMASPSDEVCAKLDNLLARVKALP